MTCFHPLNAWRKKGGYNPKTGKWKLSFSPDPEKSIYGTGIQVPCGQCVGCRIDKSLDWAVRCIHEKQMHEKNCFITLTYDDDNVPITPQGLPTLYKKHWVDFMKRLRKKYGEGIRFFHCGEYGDLLERPHYHALLFNHDFLDKKLAAERRGIRLYESEELNALWEYRGFCTVGDVTYESAAYVARYILKKQKGKKAEAYYKGRQPEYILMSRRPGIGRQWLDKYIDSVYPHDYIVKGLGQKVKPSRYYDNIYDKINSEDMEKIKKTRIEKMLKHEKDLTKSRLEVREYILKEKLKKLNRNIEKNIDI